MYSVRVLMVTSPPSCHCEPLRSAQGKLREAIRIPIPLTPFPMGRGKFIKEGLAPLLDAQFYEACLSKSILKCVILCLIK
jgi:hypothetical protein